jgi:hypothetical protein
VKLLLVLLVAALIVVGCAKAPADQPTVSGDPGTQIDITFDVAGDAATDDPLADDTFGDDLATIE